MKLKIFIIAALLSTLSNTACTAEIIICPPSISVVETVTKLPEVWTAYVDAGQRQLRNISFYDGHPDKKAELAPENETTKNGALYSTWQFDQETSNNLWISCSYSRTLTTLIRPAQNIYKSCTALSDVSVTTEGMPTLQSMECK